MRITNYFTLLSLVSTFALVILLIMLLRGLELDAAVLELLQRIESTGSVGAALFMGLVCLSVILLLPSALLTLGAGALYGVVLGSIAVVFAETIGATLAFILGRTTLRKTVSSLLVSRPRIRNTLHVLRAQDWQLVAMLRMIPFFPFKLSNYFMGVTPVTLNTYLKGTIIGLWPITVFNVYLGSLANDLLSLEQASAPQNPYQWALSGMGLLFSGIVVILAVRRATSAFADIKSTKKGGE